MSAVSCALCALSLAATKARPGGVIRPFCEADMATSMPHSSMAKGMQAREATPSTMNRAGWPAASMARRTALTSLTTPEAVSICTIRIALMEWVVSRRSRSSTLAGVDGRPPRALHHLDIGAHEGGHLAPADGEAAAGQHQHLVAARQHVGDRRLPAAMAVGGIDVGARLGAEDGLEVGEQAVRQRHHRPGIDLLGRAHHRLQHAVGNIGRAGMASRVRPLATLMGVLWRAAVKSGLPLR